MEINRKRVARRLVSGLLAGALALGGLAISGGTASAITPATTGTRIEGTDRYSTSAALATKYVANVTGGWGGNIVIAAGGNFPDGLAAASIASVKKAPILLVPSDGTLPSSVRDWLLINRNTMQTSTPVGAVTVVGGTSAVPENTVTAILDVVNGGLTTPTILASRLSGDDRYATAAAVNGATGVMGGSDQGIIVSGENFADAVSAAPLAFANGWPIILTPASGLNASALATVSALVTASSADKFIIVGGKSAVSETVETQLVEAGIPYANITRIAGADRYLTSAAVNTAMLTLNLPAGMFTGANVALVTGENYADAVASAPFLAAKTGAGEGIHVQLTASNSLSTGAAGLISTLAASAKPSSVYVIGGTTAVSAATASAAVSTAQSTNMVGVMSCPEGATSVAIVFPAGLDGTEQGALTDGDLSIDGASNATNAAAQIDDTAVTDDTAIFAVPTLVKGQTISFGGNPEAGSATKRSLSAGACVVADDATAPTVSMVLSKPGANNLDGAFVLEFSEKIAFQADAGTTDVKATSATANTLDLGDLTITKADGTTTLNYTSANSTGVALDGAAASNGGIGYASKFLITAFDNAGTPVEIDLAVTGGVKVALAAEVTKDLAGNKSAAGSGTIAATATADAAAPTLTVASVCAAAAQATISNGNLTLSAVADGAFDGSAGNGWKLSVVSKRGQVLPSVSVDADAKTVVVSADVAYSSTSDVAQYVKNNALLAGWTLVDDAGTAGTVLAATTTALATTGGTDSCAVTITSSEYLQAAPTVTATVNGVAITAPTFTAFTAGTVAMTAKTTMTGLAVPGSSVVFVVGTSRDLAGNVVSGTLTFTAN